MKVGFVSLGCSKNLVDTEMMIGKFKKQKFEIINHPSDADIILINTCGFIETAKEEAINTILEMAEYKENGKCQYLIVTGCLVKRYQKELEKALPEVDLFVSPDQYDTLWNQVETLLVGETKSANTLDYMERCIATGNTTTYLKIAEGCSNHCTYCAIPSIRGPYISRPMEEILEEAKRLADLGYQEMIVIAQDTTKYGLDLYGELKLAELLQKLCEIDKIKWIRFLYAYPESITDELIEVVKNNERICHYFDIPLQHFSDKILKKMNRKSDAKSIEKLIEKLRREIEELYGFVKRAKFDKLGAFRYSKEEGTPAAKLPNQVHYKTKQKRWNCLMREQEKIAKSKLEAKVGKTYEVLIDSVLGNTMIARSYMDIPDEDGVIYIKNASAQENVFAKCQITGVKGYDLIGKIVD